MALGRFFKRRTVDQAQVKAAEESFFPRYLGGLASLFLNVPTSRYNYAVQVGDGLLSSSVMPVIQWIQRVFPEATLQVQDATDDDHEPITPHPLTQLVANPNDAYDGMVLWMASVYDWCMWGESYWQIIPERGGRPGQLWWRPPWTIQPQWPADGSEFISHYTYSPEGKSVIRLEVEDVVHFRHGFDPRNIRHGLPPLRSVYREIWTDDEASNFVASLLRNSAVPSLLITPDVRGGEVGFPSPEQAEAIEAYITERFTGEDVGKAMVVHGPMKVERLGFSPSELDLSLPRNTAEERVSAALGIPSAVVGFHSGLESTKVGATMREMTGMAWSNGLIPMQRIMAHALARRLLPRFERRPDQFLLEWDYRRVSALQEDETAKFTRANMGVVGGWLTVKHAQQMVGMEPEPKSDVYLRSSGIVEVGPDAPEPVLLPTLPFGSPNDNGNSNGNGNSRRPQAEEDEEVATRSLLGLEQKQPMDDLISALLQQRNPGRVRRAPRALLKLVERLEREARSLELAMIRDLTPLFAELGDQAATQARQILERKQLEDAIDSSRISQGIQWLELHGLTLRVYQRHFERVATSTFTAVGEALALDVDIPDVVARAIIATAGRRAGLLDLEVNTRQALFEALAEGRAAGEGVDQLTRRIRDQIPAGIYRDSQTRARVISRTETIYAQRASVLVRGKSERIEHFMIFDGRLPTSDQECIDRQGLVVTASEAQALSELEHPNGTMSIVPINSLLYDELTESGRIRTPGGVTP